MKKFISLFIFLACCSAYSESLSIFDIDSTSFPIMKAKFFAFDKDGKQLRPNIGDFSITENGQPRTILNVTCPSLKPLKFVSIAMSIDVSGSMSYSDAGDIPVELGKTTATELCQSIAMPPSEFSLQICNDRAAILQDLTTDKNKILSKIKPITANGDNDFEEQLSNNLTGLLNIAKTGKHKRIAIIYTDAWWSALSPLQLQDCIDTCAKYNIQFFAVIYTRSEAENNGIKSSLNLLAKATDGILFDGITSITAAKMIALRLQQETQNREPCEIEWKSGISCVAGITNVELRITNLGLIANTSYQSPNSSVAKLEINPISLNLKNSTPGVKRDTTITITARNSDFNISNITVSNAAFTIIPTNFILKNGETKNLTVSFLPPDSGYIYCKFTVENDLCPAKFYSTGGFPGKKAAIRTLKLIQPNGGEVFLAGSDTIITWEGVPLNEPVTIEYRTDDNQPWVKLTDTAKGLSYKFHVPKISSNKYLTRVTAKAGIVTYDNLMILIPAGTFQMGNTGTYDGDGDEKPVHSVTISRDFLLGKYEVTQKQYVSVIGTNPSYFIGENLPVEQVNWYEAVDFCNKFSDIEGLQPCYSGSGDSVVCDWNANGYRLPTEAEWEYACKAGSITDFYNGSLTNGDCRWLDENLDKIGWYCGNGKIKTMDVGQKKPNFFGLYDMSGNVWEWCWDWYNFITYTNIAVTDPRGGSNGIRRVLRGGSWNYGASYCRSSLRHIYCHTSDKYFSFGFRICRNF